jgi:hypothetical protein
VRLALAHPLGSRTPVYGATTGKVDAAGQGVYCPDAPETKGALPFTDLMMDIHGLKHGNGLIRILFPG